MDHKRDDKSPPCGQSLMALMEKTAPNDNSGMFATILTWYPFHIVEGGVIELRLHKALV